MKLLKMDEIRELRTQGLLCGFLLMMLFGEKLINFSPVKAGVAVAGILVTVGLFIWWLKQRKESLPRHTALLDRVTVLHNGWLIPCATLISTICAAASLLWVTLPLFGFVSLLVTCAMVLGTHTNYLEGSTGSLATEVAIAGFLTAACGSGGSLVTLVAWIVVCLIELVFFSIHLIWYRAGQIQIPALRWSGLFLLASVGLMLLH